MEKLALDKELEDHLRDTFHDMLAWGLVEADTLDLDVIAAQLRDLLYAGADQLVMGSRGGVLRRGPSLCRREPAGTRER